MDTGHIKTMVYTEHQAYMKKVVGDSPDLQNAWALVLNGHRLSLEALAQAANLSFRRDVLRYCADSWGPGMLLFDILKDGNTYTKAQLQLALKRKKKSIRDFVRFLRELRSLPFVAKNDSFREVQLLDLFTVLSQHDPPGQH